MTLNNLLFIEVQKIVHTIYNLQIMSASVPIVIKTNKLANVKDEIILSKTWVKFSLNILKEQMLLLMCWC